MRLSHRSCMARLPVATSLLRRSQSTTLGPPIVATTPVRPAAATGKAEEVRTLELRKPRVVVVGCGWAGFRFALDIDKSNTAVGTLEFRAIEEPVRTIPDIHYSQASAEHIDFDQQVIHCSDAFEHGYDFQLAYDALVLAPGTETNTFGVPGVYDNEYVHFLKQLKDTRGIRNKLIESFERASSPAVKTDAEREKLLNFVVVGGGPTSVEFAAELFDFLQEDVARWYPDLYHLVKVQIVEASGHILGSFNESLVNYVEKLFRNRKINLITGTSVKEVRANVAVLSDGSEVPFGLMVWSTGIKQIPLIHELDKDKVGKFPNGRLKVDQYLQVLRAGNAGAGGHSALGNVFAMGDCAGDVDKPLPALAQVALQQGKYLAKMFNAVDAPKAGSLGFSTEFKYQHLGSMASVGQWKGVFDSPADGYGPPVKGFLAFALWRSAYWTKQVSLVNKMLIPMYWFKCWLFGRDISRF